MLNDKTCELMLKEVKAVAVKQNSALAQPHAVDSAYPVHRDTQFGLNEAKLAR